MKKIVVLLIALLMVGGFVFADGDENTFVENFESCYGMCPKRGCVDVIGCSQPVVCLRVEGLFGREGDEEVLVDDPEGNRCPCVTAFIPVLAPMIIPDVTMPLANIKHKSNCRNGYTIMFRCENAELVSPGVPSILYGLNFMGCDIAVDQHPQELCSTDSSAPGMTPVSGQYESNLLSATYDMGFYPSGCYWDRIYLHISAN